MRIKVRAIFKGKPAHKITLEMFVDGDSPDHAFQNFARTAKIDGRVTVSGYSFAHEDVLYYELTDYDTEE